MIKAKYYDGVTSNSHDAEIELWKDRIYIIIKTGNVEWFYDKAIVQENASRHNSGKIGYDDAPEAQLIFEDRKQFAEVAAKLPARRKPSILKTSILYILSIALLVFTIFLIVPALAPAIGDNMPTSWEEKLGNFVRNSFTSNYKTCKNSQGQAALDKIVATLAKQSNSKYQFTSVVVENKDMNAFAAPAGRMMIFSGLIEKAGSESEITGVLAHEIGHAVKRHGVDGLIRTILTTLIIDAITGGGGSAIYLGKQAIELDYNRDAEAEADSYALYLLDKTNTNPSGLLEFFRKAEEENNKYLGKYTKDYDLSFFSTHPATSTRMGMVKSQVDSKRAYTNILTLQEWNALKAICQ